MLWTWMAHRSAPHSRLRPRCRGWLSAVTGKVLPERNLRPPDTATRGVSTPLSELRVIVRVQIGALGAKKEDVLLKTPRESPLCAVKRIAFLRAGPFIAGAAWLRTMGYYVCRPTPVLFGFFHWGRIVMGSCSCQPVGLYRLPPPPGVGSRFAALPSEKFASDRLTRSMLFTCQAPEGRPSE